MNASSFRTHSGLSHPISRQELSAVASQGHGITAVALPSRARLFGQRGRSTHVETVGPAAGGSQACRPVAALKAPNDDCQEGAPIVADRLDLPFEGGTDTKIVKLVVQLPHGSVVEGMDCGELKVVGSCSELGGWDPALAPLMDKGLNGQWSLCVALPAGTPCDFKVVMVDANGSELWEGGANRWFVVPTGPSTMVLECTWNNTGSYVANFTPVTDPSQSLLVTDNVRGAQEWIAAWRASQRDSAVPEHVLDSRRWIAAWRASQGAAIPDNILEAREWIAAWRATQGAAIPDNAFEAREWIAAWRATQGAAIPDNAFEAREWIAAWRASQGRLGPDNVVEAREWIAAWRASQGGAVPDNVLEAREWIAAWRASQGEAVPETVLEARRWIAAWTASHGRSVPDNVLEAREWIAAWRAFQGAAVPDHVLAAREWIAAWRASQGAVTDPSNSVPDPSKLFLSWISKHAHPSRRHLSPGAALPSNFVETQMWMAEWRTPLPADERQGEGGKTDTAVVAVQTGESPAAEADNAAVVRKWIKAWRAQQAPSAGAVSPEGAAGSEVAPACTLTESAGNGRVLDLRCTRRPDTVHSLAQLLVEGSERAIAERGAFCLVLTGSELQNAAVLLAEIAGADVSKWHLFWARECNVEPTSIDSNYGIAKVTFLSRSSWSSASVHYVESQPGGPHEAAVSYEAALKAVPEAVLPRTDSGLPSFDMVLAGPAAGGALESEFSHSPDGEWVLPVTDSAPGAVKMSLSLIEVAARVVIHDHE